MILFQSIKTKRFIVCCCAIVSLMLFARQCYVTYKDTVAYGGTDLRARIVGSRLMSQGLDPFFTKWKPVLGERLCDPNDKFYRPVNGVTATPFMLWLQLPLAWFNYGTIRITWWGIQQLLLILIAAVCMYFYRHSLYSVAAIAIVSGVLCNHPAWMLHAERGQIYLLYAAWIALLFVVWRYSRVNNAAIIILAAWLAIGALLRPTLVVFAVPSFLSVASNKRIVLIIVSFLSVLVLLLVSNTWIYWPRYLSAMQVYSNMEIYESAAFSATPEFPQVIEGTTNITIYKQHPGMMYIASLEYYFEKMGHKPGTTVYIFICLLVNSVVLLLVYVKTKWKMSYPQLLMLGTLLYVCTDVCQPLRMAYNVVMWLPAALVMTGYFFVKGNRKINMG